MAKLLEMARNKDTCDAVKTMATHGKMKKMKKKKMKKGKKKQKEEEETKKKEAKVVAVNKKKRKAEQKPPLKKSKKKKRLKREEEEEEEEHQDDDGKDDSEMRRQLESDEVLRSQRDALHVKETKEAAANILEQCKEHLDKCALDMSESPALAVSRCDDFINNMVHHNGMMGHKLDMARKTRDLAVEPVKRQWEESFLQEPSGDQCACVKFNLGRCIANELYSSTHGSDFTLRRPSRHASRGAHEGRHHHRHQATTTTSTTRRRRRRISRPAVQNGDVPVAVTCVLCPRGQSKERCRRRWCCRTLPISWTLKESRKLQCDLQSAVSVRRLLDPVVAVNRNYFEPFMHDGLRCLRQVLPYARQRPPGGW